MLKSSAMILGMLCGSILLFTIAVALWFCGRSVPVQRPDMPHNGSLSQTFLDWRCDCPKCLHVRECIAEITREQVAARNGVKQPKLSNRDKEFVATVHKLEFLLKSTPGEPPLSPVRGPGERDSYARFKNYVLNTDGRGLWWCANCQNKMDRTQRDTWHFCPECGTHFGGFEVMRVD